MVHNIISEMLVLTLKVQEYIKQDIEDIKKAKHEELLNRNNEKQSMVEGIENYKQELNKEILKQMEDGIDVNIYRKKIDNLEFELKKLFELNRKLALIVEPIQKMYKEIIDDIVEKNGGSIINVQA